MDEKLNQDITALKAAIADVNDAKAKAELESLLQQLENDMSAGNDSTFNTADLSEAVSRLEAEHPQATSLLNQVLQTLSNLGI